MSEENSNTFTLGQKYPPFEFAIPQARWVGLIRGPEGHVDITVLADSEEDLDFRMNTILQAFQGVPYGLMHR